MKRSRAVRAIPLLIGFGILLSACAVEPDYGPPGYGYADPVYGSLDFDYGGWDGWGFRHHGSDHGLVGHAGWGHGFAGHAGFGGHGGGGHR
jgi:hypothetical protein